MKKDFFVLRNLLLFYEHNSYREQTLCPVNRNNLKKMLGNTAENKYDTGFSCNVL